VNINTKYPGGWLDINEGRMIEDEKVSYRETWEGMEGLVKEGLVRNIGCCVSQDSCISYFKMGNLIRNLNYS